MAEIGFVVSSHFIDLVHPSSTATAYSLCIRYKVEDVNKLVDKNVDER